MVKLTPEAVEAIRWLKTRTNQLETALAEVKRLANKLDRFKVHGALKFSNQRDTMSLAVHSPGGTGVAQDRDDTYLVKVVSNATGGGKYFGKVWNRPAAQSFSSSGNLAESELGQQATDAPDVLVFNAAESGQSTHDLTTGTPISKVFVARSIGPSADGYRTFVINGSDWENCTS